jgi:pentatricopeptide repeat protein
MYARCGGMVASVNAYGACEKPDLVLRTSVVTGYEQNGLAEAALEFFTRNVVGQGIAPSLVTLVSVISAAAQLGDVLKGKACHAFVLRSGLEFKLALANAVLGFYTKIGAVQAARRLFERMANRDVVTWSCMVKGYVQSGDALNALEVYKEMIETGIQPNSVTLVSVLQACALATDIEEGRRIHHTAGSIGCELEVGVATALVDMYMKCSCHEEAIRLFHRMPKKDVVIWAAVISGLKQNGLPDESLQVFKCMLLDGHAPDAVTMVKLLAACSESGVICQAICLHGYLVRSGFYNKVFVSAALVDLYSKCGSLDSAVKIFESATEKDVVLWTSMIAGYGIHGLGKEAVSLYQRMIASPVRPSSVTFVSLLSACSHSGLVQEGKQIFDSMIQVYRIMPDPEHQSAIIDLLARAGELQEATRVINEMGGTDVAHTWCALLAACRAHNNTEMSEMVAKNLLPLDPGHVGYYNLLTNIYAFDQKWERVKETREMARGKCMNKIPGYSAVEVNNVVHKFTAGEMSHPDWEKICKLIWELSRKLRGESYSFHVNTDLALEDYALL